MKIDYKFTKEDITEVKADIVAVECKKISNKSKKPGELLKEDGGIALDKKLGGLIGRIIKEEEFEGELGEIKVIHTDGKIGAKKIVVFGIGNGKEFSLDLFRKLGAEIARVANDLRAGSLVIVPEPRNINKLPVHERMQALSEGITLGGYKSERYKDKKDIKEHTLKTLILAFSGKTAQISNALILGTEIADAINYARELVNVPAEDMTPDILAKEAQKICKGNLLSCQVLDEKDMRRERMNLILAVSRGSENSPRFIHIKYRPAGKAKATIALLGKGVTFDSGGYNLKPSRHIEMMKDDMAGAAAVLATMKLLPVLKPKVSVDAYIPASENMIDAKAQKPGDIIKSRNGKTVEINNTDAEGRLLLADALDFALQKKPDIMIDIATLTGGVLYALGEIYTAIIGNDQKLIDKLIAASKEGGEPTWQLPLEKEYLKGFKESIADLTNTGKSGAATITGALFLSEFVGDTKWAHMDIAESSWYKEDRGYHHKGGTGTGVQTFVKFLMNY